MRKNDEAWSGLDAVFFDSMGLACVLGAASIVRRRRHDSHSE
jgi:hypothetical protein